MKRLFVAIHVHPEEQFLRHYYSLKKELSYEKIKWVDPDNLHLTLKFLGATEEEKIPIINNTLYALAKNYAPLSFTIENTGIFGSRYNPRVLWFGISNGKQLMHLGQEILNSLNDAGFPRDRQNFVPHLTIGRIKKIANKRLFQKIIDRHKTIFLQEVSVRQMVLYESVLHSTGPIYYPVKTFFLDSEPNHEIFPN